MAEAEKDRAEKKPRSDLGIQGVWVAAVALAALVGVVAITVLSLPDDQKGQNIIAIGTASFGVIGAIVGAFFGVTSANRAAEIVRDVPTGETRDTTMRQRREDDSAGA